MSFQIPSNLIFFFKFSLSEIEPANNINEEMVRGEGLPQLTFFLFNPLRVYIRKVDIAVCGGRANYPRTSPRHCRCYRGTTVLCNHNRIYGGVRWVIWIM